MSPTLMFLALLDPMFPKKLLRLELFEKLMMDCKNSRLSQCLVLLRVGYKLEIPQVQSHSRLLCKLFLSGYTKKTLPFPVGFIFMDFRL